MFFPPEKTFAQIRALGWPDATANDVIPYDGSGLTHGPLLGRPAATSMRVWVRTAAPGPFRVVYAPSLPLSADGPGVAGETNAGDDNTGVVDLTGLAPDTRYYYGIVLNERIVDTRNDFAPGFPSFRTLPDCASYADERYNPDGRFNFSFGVGFGARQTSSEPMYRDAPGFHSLNARYADRLSFFIMNGDYIYEEFRTAQNRPHEAEMFRADYRSYMEHGLAMTEFQRRVPWLYTYDDHETFSDLEGAGEIGLKQGKWLYRDRSLGPWYEYAGWANYPGPQRGEIYRGEAEVKAGGDVLHDPNADFTQLRPETISTLLVDMGQKNQGVYGLVETIDAHHVRVTPAFAENETCTYSIGTHHYFDWRVGNCHFFALDTRGERTRYLAKKVNDPDRFLLGATQEKWLLDGIAGTDADFIFIVSSVSWMIYHTNFHMYKDPAEIPPGPAAKEDGFLGAIQERDRLLAALDAIEKPVIIFTGDLHNAFAVQISDNVWEFMTGPFNSFNHPILTAGNPPPPYGGWFDSAGTNVKIKWVAGFPNEMSYQRLTNKYYGIVQVNNALKSGRQEGPGLHWVAYDEPQVIVQFIDAYTGEMVYAEGISTADAKPASQGGRGAAKQIDQ
ncbi:MAG: alkaline phosphatase D family protein [Candidatus Hydrogenedentes bacterium]|nr:alkaline phosphatase D family protein [Candidatus Hydrogenedentota bacterium]